MKCDCRDMPKFDLLQHDNVVDGSCQEGGYEIAMISFEER